MIRDQTALIFSPLFTAVHALTWAKVTAQLKLNILRKLDRTRCSEPEIQALALVKQADQHLIRPRRNLRMSRYWLPPPNRKVWFQKWEKYTSSSAVVAAAGHFCGRRRSDAADGSILDASLTANQPKLQTDIPGVRAEEISIIYDSV